MRREVFREKYPVILFTIYLVIWIALAIKPLYRSVWIDENILTVLFVGLLVWSYKRLRLSNSSYTFLFFFMVLHAVGGHYSYNEMPLFEFIQQYFELSRNHYDRVVHFLFGVLFFVPVYDVLERVFQIPKQWRNLVLTFLVVVAFKGMFEVIEYSYVWIKADPLTVTNYLGEQGDAWDAQKDVGLGIIGAILSWIVIGVWRLKKSFFNS